jgi:hypothetical protein
MPIEDSADVGAPSHAGDDLVRDRRIDLLSLFPRLVERCERARISARALEPGGRDRVGDREENLVRILEGESSLRGQVPGDLDSSSGNG